MKKAAFRTIIAVGFLVGCLGSGAAGQLDVAATDDRALVLDMLEPRPAGPTINTALAFTNPWNREVKVRLQAFDSKGEQAGTASFVLAPRELKYFFVSRLVGEVDPRFVGWVRGETSLPISPSAVLVGAGVTDLPVEKRARPATSVRDAARRYEVLFPLTAAF